MAKFADPNAADYAERHAIEGARVILEAQECAYPHSLRDALVKLLADAYRQGEEDWGESDAADNVERDARNVGRDEGAMEERNRIEAIIDRHCMGETLQAIIDAIESGS